MTAKSVVESVIVVSVPVSDQERAKAFYADELGFKVVRDDPSVPGMRWVQLEPADGGTNLLLATWFDSMPAGSFRGLVLRMADLRRTYEALSRKGIEFDGPPVQQPYALEAVVHDPDGNAIILQQR